MAIAKLGAFDALKASARAFWKPTTNEYFEATALTPEITWYPAKNQYYADSAPAYATVAGIDGVFNFANNKGLENVVWTPATKQRKDGTPYDVVIPSVDFKLKAIEVVCDKENEFVSVGETRQHIVLI